MDPADQLYDAIRFDNSDIELIANNTGWKAKSIARIKNHLFVGIHLLDKYEKLGVPPIEARFDSDMQIAKAWSRLRNNSFNKTDLKLLRHEAAESWYMRKHGPSYRKAHAAAQKRFPAPLELWS